MANKKHNSLSSRLRFQKTKKEQPSILQEEGEKWNWTRIAILVVLIYAGMTFMNGCFSIIDLKAQQNAIVAQTQEAQSKQSDLENEVSYMQTQEAVEKTAREDLKMVKPGEILLTQRENTTDDQKDTDASTENSDTTE
ncbi:MAG: septum formation initiator family protein [Peptococcaceae bacterium]|nr:septum formation initiator family protein [Peptococcaceae bacterium]